MPSEIGGKKFVSDFRGMIQSEVAKALEKGRAKIVEATSELTREIEENAAGAARMIRQEAKHIRDGFEDYLGNNAPDDEPEAVEVKSVDVGALHVTDGKPDPTPSQSGGDTAS